MVHQGVAGGQAGVCGDLGDGRVAGLNGCHPGLATMDARRRCRHHRRRRLQALKSGHRLERIVKERKAGDDQRRKAEADSPAKGREDK